MIRSISKRDAAIFTSHIGRMEIATGEMSSSYQKRIAVQCLGLYHLEDRVSFWKRIICRLAMMFNHAGEERLESAGKA